MIRIPNNPDNTHFIKIGSIKRKDALYQSKRIYTKGVILHCALPLFELKHTKGRLIRTFH